MKRVLSLYLPTWSTDLIERRVARREDQGIKGQEAGGTKQETEDRRQARTRTHRRPILLTRTVADRELIERCCPLALNAGVRSGMTLAHARALLPFEGQNKVKQQPQYRQHAIREPYIETYNAPYNAAALFALAEWATRFAPIVAPDPTADSLIHASRDIRNGTSQLPGLLIDITGCNRLYRNEHQLIDQLANGVQRMGFACRVATAPTFGCAWAAARFGASERTVVEDHAVVEMLAPLPVRSLRIEPDIEAALAEVAVDRVSDLIALPRHALPCRFGDDILLRLDQAFGHAIETITPVRPMPPLDVAFALNGPTTQHEAIRLIARQLLEQLADHLQQREVGATQLDIELTRIEENGVRTGIMPLTIRTSHPTRNLKHLWSLLQPQLERVHLGHGVEHIAMTASRTARLPHQQSECWQPRDAAVLAELDRHFGQLIDALQHQLGNERVQKLHVTATHQPERAFVYHAIKPLATPSSSRVKSSQNSPLRIHTTEPVAITDSDRPTVLFAFVEPVEVVALTPDGPPQMVRWRGRQSRVLSSVGPQRIAQRWWEDKGTKGQRGEGAKGAINQAHRRSTKDRLADDHRSPLLTASSHDYFKVQTEHGDWLWVRRDMETGRWFVCGRWS